METEMELINELCHIIDSIDSDPLRSLKFYTGSSQYDSNELKPFNIRYTLIFDILEFLDPEHTVTKTSRILESINSKYQQHQHLCWKSHEHHFHINFEDYVNCPTTCLCEISEFLQKLEKQSA